MFIKLRSELTRWRRDSLSEERKKAQSDGLKRYWRMSKSEGEHGLDIKMKLVVNTQSVGAQID